MDREYFLGIDVGTTGTKTLLIAADGEICAHAYEGYALAAPKDGYSEQEAEDWWEAVVHTVRAVCAQVADPHQVRAISLSLQGGTIVPVDEAGAPLRPAIVWSDGRCSQEFQAFQAEGGSDQYAYERTGWHMSAGLPALQIRWIREHQPDIFARSAMFLSVPDYVSRKMTGIPAVDLADAGINQLCDIRAGVYDEKLLDFAGVKQEQLAQIVRTGDVIGPLTPDAADALGLTTETLLIAGAHDQYAVAVGAGANAPGDVLIGSGTAWVVTGISDQSAFQTGLAQSVAAVPGMWGSIFSLSTGGVCLEWLRKEIAPGLTYDEINEQVQGRTAAERGLFYFPFQGIAGEGKRFSRASFTGLDLAHDRFALARSVMEGVVFQTKWMMESFDTSGLGSIRLAGGASKSAVWAQMIADIMNLPVHIPEVADLACVGAAVIAGWGAGIYGSIREGSERMKVGTRLIEPDPERAAAYARHYARYQRQAELLYTLYQSC